jgi:N-acetyl-anhydromuramyl-L-alanine amidase AmpD
MPEPKIYSTADWGARSPNSSNFTKRAAAGLVIHNTEHSNRAPLQDAAERSKAFAIARSIQKDHLDRGWADTGQHFLISRGGLIMEGRHGSLQAAKEGKVARGAHANSNLHNTTWFGIELEGDNRTAFAVTDQQWASLIELCAWLSFWGEFNPANIKGHLEVSSTDCPGKVMGHLAELRDKVASRKSAIVDGGA